jgi:hypothetical protein
MNQLLIFNWLAAGVLKKTTISGAKTSNFSLLNQKDIVLMSHE